LMPEPVDLATAIRALRRHADLSQRELAERADVPQATIARIESGRAPNPHFRTVERLVRAAGGVLAVRAAGAGELPANPHEGLCDRAERHYPAHLDVREVTSPEQWWGAWWTLTMVRSHWPLHTVPKFTYDLNRLERDQRRARERPP